MMFINIIVKNHSTDFHNDKSNNLFLSLYHTFIIHIINVLTQVIKPQNCVHIEKISNV